MRVFSAPYESDFTTCDVFKFHLRGKFFSKVLRNVNYKELMCPHNLQICLRTRCLRFSASLAAFECDVWNVIEVVSHCLLFGKEEKRF